ncbi:hypothetical protein N184_30930 [Sinorhizobium sp. GL28]|nr:hypothetical protein N184_30930 [Sinorhizobium sp. GL28]
MTIFIFGRLQGGILLLETRVTTLACHPSSLRELSLNLERREEFVEACQSAVASGVAALHEIVAAIRGTRWRFILTNSGQAIEVQHKDDLYATYWEAVAQMKSCRHVIGQDEYDQEIIDRIRDCETAHQRARLFMTADDNLGHFEHEIFDLFDGTGYVFDGHGISPGDDYDQVRNG